MLNAPKVIDLYSGVGGLSLGAVKAGFEIVAAVEREKRILDSHARNFPKAKHLCHDVSALNGDTLRVLSGLKKTELAGLIGGPPCQGFSSIGKKDVDDKRNRLFVHFFQLVSEIEPAFFVAENVPGILKDPYLGIRNEAKNLVEAKYEVLEPIKITASEFGAPTIRTRVFFIGVRKDVNGANKVLSEIESVKSSVPVFVKDALEGLPEKISDKWLEYKDSWQKLTHLNANEYLRSLNGFNEDVGDQEALHRFQKKEEVSGCFGTRHSPAVEDRYGNLRPGQQDKISKSQKLNINGFCPTLRAGTDSTKGSFQAVRPIHPLCPRVITPREAARLQGFPDWFMFHETKWHSFRQIGNSVCPIVASKVLRAVKNSLRM